MKKDYNPKACQVCGIVPRAMWMLSRTPFWADCLPERLCLSCARWAEKLGLTCRWLKDL